MKPTRRTSTMHSATSRCFELSMSDVMSRAVKASSRVLI